MILYIELVVVDYLASNSTHVLEWTMCAGLGYTIPTLSCQEVLLLAGGTASRFFVCSHSDVGLLVLQALLPTPSGWVTYSIPQVAGILEDVDRQCSFLLLGYYISVPVSVSLRKNYLYSRILRPSAVMRGHNAGNFKSVKLLSFSVTY
jgi:hypothetical protein